MVAVISLLAKNWIYILYAAILGGIKINIIGALKIVICRSNFFEHVLQRKKNRIDMSFNQIICISSGTDTWGNRRKRSEAGFVAGRLALCCLAHIDTYQLLKAAIHPYHPSTAPCDIRCLTTTNPITFILS